MKRKVAEQIHELMISFSGALAESVEVVEAGGDADETAQYREAVTMLLGTMLEEIMVPIYDQHPALIPTALKESLTARAKKKAKK
ncbi:MAG: hypothetical protein ABIP89_16385 [Polyangiaceae bacterium]